MRSRRWIPSGGNPSVPWRKRPGIAVIGSSPPRTEVSAGWLSAHPQARRRRLGPQLGQTQLGLIRRSGRSDHHRTVLALSAYQGTRYHTGRPVHTQPGPEPEHGQYVGLWTPRTLGVLIRPPSPHIRPARLEPPALLANARRPTSQTPENIESSASCADPRPRPRFRRCVMPSKSWPMKCGRCRRWCMRSGGHWFPRSVRSLLRPDFVRAYSEREK